MEQKLNSNSSAGTAVDSSTQPIELPSADIAASQLLAAGEFSGRYKGNDNSGKPKLEYLKKMVLMSDEELRKECESKIWLSAYASNNHRSDYHWHCDCCYDECKRRGKEDIYSKAHKSVSDGL